MCVIVYLALQYTDRSRPDPLFPISPPEQMQRGRPLDEDGPYCHGKTLLDSTAKVS
jgi:hypothetical protein